MATNMRWIGLGTLLGALALGATSGRAEDAPSAAEAAWRFDVRVVRVEAQAPMVERAPTLPGQQPDGTLAAPWGDVLAALKQRGTARILMDRSGTGLVSRTVSLDQSHVEQVMTTVRTDGDKTFVESRPLHRGAGVSLTRLGGADSGATTLDYQVAVDWRAATSGDGKTSKTSWRGAYRHEPGRMLLLRHAEQDGKGGGVEVYVLIEGRPLPR
jgi:hypothetical protein